MKRGLKLKNHLPHAWKPRRALLGALLVIGAGLLATETQGADPDGWLSKVEFQVGGPAEALTVRESIIEDIDRATRRIDAALFHLEDEDIARALVRAKERGVAMRLVADDTNRGGAGFAILEAGGLTPVYGNGQLVYLPDPTLSPMLEDCRPHSEHIECRRGPGDSTEFEGQMVRPGNFNQMSHTFFLIDAITIWNLSTPLSGERAYWLGWRMESEEAMRSFEREFTQMHGGVFSTTLSVYNGPLKSLTHPTPIYPTNLGTMSVQFNPQERLAKNVIDEIYRARSSVFIMTEDLANDFILNALEYKKNAGFDVRVIVGKRQRTGDVGNRVKALGARRAPADMDRLPTLIILDSERDRHGKRPPRIVQSLSHKLWRGAPFDVTFHAAYDRVLIYPSDTFVDGNMWEILESSGQTNRNIDPFVSYWKNIWRESSNLVF